LLFELDKYDPKLHQLAPAVPRLPYQPVSNIDKMSVLYWGEHCIECAAPSCYHTCDLYEPRTDTRCRRFTFGAFKNRNFPSFRGYGVEISFKKWAKLEAYGNLRLFPPAFVLCTEKLAALAAPGANLLGKLMARITNRPRWKAVTHVALDSLVRRFHRQRPANAFPDAFLLELYNPTDEVLPLQVSFSPLSAEAPSPSPFVQLSQTFSTTLSCPLGYSRHQIDFALFRRLVDSASQFVISMTPESGADARLVFLTAEFVNFAARPQASALQPVKCVVFDLDNTLWRGVLVEGDALDLHPSIPALLKHLDQRGILLSVASKNDHAPAWKKLEELGLADYFLYPQINWSPKSHGVKAVADRLNIAVDSLAFVDDNPFELDEVSSALPGVLCLHARDLTSLFSDPRFQGSSTPDARRRRQLYRDSAAREVAQESFGSDYHAFLSSCQIVLQVSPYSPEESERVAELVQRTNQLNFSGHKHTRLELQQLLDDPRLDKFVLKSSDRYGSYGTIGFCIVQRAPHALCIQDFMLSCRVQGKLLEKAFFHHLLEQHNPDSAPALWINFRPTARNQPALRVLESLGCVPGDSAAHHFPHGNSYHRMILASAASLRCDFIQVRCPCLSPSSGATSFALASTRKEES
jgi:FkbH-like protein